MSESDEQMAPDSKDFIELCRYASLENTEIGDYVRHLTYLRDFKEDHGMSLEFSQALNKELLSWLNEFREKTEIIEVVEPQPDRRYDELVWKYEQ